MTGPKVRRNSGLYKDRMEPARVRFAGDTKTQGDVRFLDYTSQATGDFFPRTFKVC